MALTLDQLRKYLGAAADQWDDDELGSALAAELDDQATKCRVPTVVPAGLTEALKRRVARNLAMRKVPLGIAVSEVEATQVRNLDPEIKRFEAPYRRRDLA